MQMISLSPTDS